MILVLFLVYYVISLAISFLFAATGHGSYTPPAILFSWSYFLTRPLQNAYTFFLFPAVYLLVVSGVIQSARRLLRRRIVLGFAFLHLVGSVLGAAHVEHGHLATPFWITLSSGISYAVLIAFFVLVFYHADVE